NAGAGAVNAGVSNGSGIGGAAVGATSVNTGAGAIGATGVNTGAGAVGTSSLNSVNTQSVLDNTGTAGASGTVAPAPVGRNGTLNGTAVGTTTNTSVTGNLNAAGNSLLVNNTNYMRLQSGAVLDASGRVITGAQVRGSNIIDSQGRPLSVSTYIDTQGRLVDLKGNVLSTAIFADATGRLVNANGQYINSSGQFVDLNGNVIAR
ncbi:MAG: hypothetical protein K0R10_930, partial [Alphaproteobacteria bacterium]|nr:hypothetical protein [Alphaproteobacteria bacterium]